MTWLFDSPTTVAILGFVLVAGLAVSWIMSGRKEPLYATIGAILLVAGLLVAERAIVTDREAIRATLLEIAADVQSNKISRVLPHIAASAPKLKSQAQTELPNYQFTELRVTAIHSVEVDDKADPRTGVIEFNVVADGTFRQGSDSFSGTVPRWVQLTLVKEADGQWRITGYQHAEPQQMLRRTPAAN
jgi:hypothetical protein